jgi:16S rRNA (guanine527-N7)-methyltransferase
MASRHDFPAEPRDLAARLVDRAIEKWDIHLAGSQFRQIEQYLVLLARWNRTINLTALPLEGFPGAALDRLVGEPLTAAKHVPDLGGTWFDLGSGGGSPAIPLKIARPSLALVMIESRSRKAAFLGEAVRRLGLERTVVLAGRIEKLDPATAGTVDLVTVRAVRADPGLLEAVEVLLKPGGRLMLFTSPRAQPAPSSGGYGSAFREFSAVPLPGSDSLLRILVRQHLGG